MPTLQSCQVNDFNATPPVPRVYWFKPNNNHGDPADLAANAYSDDQGLRTLTVRPVVANQVITVSVCAPAPGLRCNIEAGTGLLLAQNMTNAPLWIEFGGNGVARVGAFMVAAAPRRTPFTPQLWAEYDGSGSFLNVRGNQGVTEDIWQNPGDSVAPFVGAEFAGGERITSIKFDAILHTATQFDPIGIGYLYYVV